jgi:hypothetical protein
MQRTAREHKVRSAFLEAVADCVGCTHLRCLVDVYMTSHILVIDDHIMHGVLCVVTVLRLQLVVRCIANGTFLQNTDCRARRSVADCAGFIRSQLITQYSSYHYYYRPRLAR